MNLELIRKLDVFDELIKGIEEKKNINVTGLTDEATGHFLLNYLLGEKRPVFVVCENDKKARKIFEDLHRQLPSRVFFFPDQEINFQQELNYDYMNRMQRLRAIQALVEGTYGLVISYPSALMNKLEDKKTFESMIIDIDMETKIDPLKLAESLLDRGYEREQIVQAKGEFAIRGDIIDIFQVGDDNPVRIELFGDEIDSMRSFDVSTQLSINNIDGFRIYPANEYQFTRLNVNRLVKEIEEDMERTKKTYGEEVYKKAYDKFNKVCLKLIDQTNDVNTDLIIPYGGLKSVSILDYLDINDPIISLDLTRVIEEYKDIEGFLYDQYKYGLETGYLLSRHSESYFSQKEIFSKLLNRQIINISLISRSLKNLRYDDHIEISTIDTSNFNSSWTDFISHLKFRLLEGYKLFIFADGKERKKNLIDQMAREDLYPSQAEDLSDLNRLEGGKLFIFQEAIDKGVDYPEAKLEFISYYEIFSRARKKLKRSKKIINDRDFINYTDLEIGDYVVHESYGVARYLGIQNIEVQGAKRDYIELLYGNKDKLFIPTSDMDQVSKYVGSGDVEPKLSKLNSTEWTKTRTRAKKAIDEIADNLVKLYAERAKIKGYKFSKDTPWQKEFEDYFIYEETPSQLTAIAEIKEDMESDKPMDRLLCGDVGYGKTEVAFRAAFKAVMDGKQAIMLAPTTILVKQHFKNMADRFKEFPIGIDFLSRFKTQGQKNDIKRKLKSGEIDFIVGTHSLLADSIEFKDPGILIVDEEQRFGVSHKEKIKDLSKNIDVLTLSATPIPRTLQMSLSGIREMSLLQEAPQNRLPINTFVMEYEPAIIRRAILKELSRDGQIYFVYNRVRGLNIMKRHLEDLVPEARIAISHGQMSPREIDSILDSFIKKEIDILLTTTIIETGIDIQNVNTIIVYNADQMGLSQLYQLKGRIGRSDRSSYAYFTFEKNKVISEVAEKRLKAIKDFNELGSGYKIAMRDLELRGAGNLLGESQSGHIEAVGYDLYVKMLKDAIDKVKGVEKPRQSRAKIELRIDAFIPSYYIEDESEKINMYKKISYIDGDKAHEAIVDELIDRFGDIPEPVENLVNIALLKTYMDQLSFDEMIEVENEVEFIYDDFNIFTPKDLEELSKNYKEFMRFDLSSKKKIIIRKDKNIVKRSLDLLKLIRKIKGESDEKN